MMKFFARMVGCLALAMALCAVLFCFAGTWFDKKGSALWPARLLIFEMRRREAMEHRSEVAKHLLESKARIVLELVGGRLRLREAIDLFQRLNKEMIEALTTEEVEQGMMTEWVPPPTDPERVGRQVLTWVREEVVDWPPDKAERLLADFEHEFRELFGRGSLSDSSTDTELTRPDVAWNREPRTVRVSLAARVSNKRDLEKNAD